MFFDWLSSTAQYSALHRSIANKIHPLDSKDTTKTSKLKQRQTLRIRLHQPSLWAVKKDGSYGCNGNATFGR